MEKEGKLKRTLPIEGRCQYFLERKRRFCRLIPEGEARYCPEHSSITGESERKRVPCPYDSAHTVFEANLQKHLKKCNSREKEKPVWFQKSVNSDEDASDLKFSIKGTPEDEILELISKVNRIVEEETFEIERQVHFHDVLKAESEKPDNGANALKHVKQQASLIAQLERLGHLKPNRTFVEFGAGKGHMSHWIQQALSSSESTNFLLVDRSACRYKLDVQHGANRPNEGPAFERIRIDIDDLLLGRVPSVAGSRQPIVAVSKHLCGPATDLALRCLLNLQSPQEPLEKRYKTEDVDLSKETEPAVSSVKSRVEAVVIALCCHHHCRWSHYCGKSFLQRHGVTPRQFALLTSMVGWATCGFIDGAVYANDDTDHGTLELELDPKKSLKQLSDSQKEQIGRRCKRLLDLGRMDYLRNNGLKAKLVYYTDASITPENVALVAHR